MLIAAALQQVFSSERNLESHFWHSGGVHEASVFGQLVARRELLERRRAALAVDDAVHTARARRRAGGLARARVLRRRRSCGAATQRFESLSRIAFEFDLKLEFDYDRQYVVVCVCV